MSRVSSLLTCVLVLTACLAVVAPQAQAAVLFSDGLESSTVGVIPAVTDPEPGTWDYTANQEGSIILTKTGATTNGPTAAYAGNNYLHIARDTNGKLPFARAMLSSPADLTTGSVSANFQMFFKGASTNIVTASLMKDVRNSAFSPQSSTLVPLAFGDNLGTGVGLTNVWYWNGGSDWVDTGIDLTDNSWNAISMNWSKATGKFTLGVNSSTWEAPSVWGTADSISNLQFTTAWNTGAMFLDQLSINSSAVPEPSALVLLAGGLVGLLAYAWRKRK